MCLDFDPFSSCCARIRLHGHSDPRINGNYALTPEMVGEKVLYKQDDRYVLKEEACFIYYNNSNYCVGSDPTKSCANDRLLARSQDFLSCPQVLAKTMPLALKVFDGFNVIFRI